MKYNIGDKVVDEDGNTGYVAIMWRDGDIAYVDQLVSHPNPVIIEKVQGGKGMIKTTIFAYISGEAAYKKGVEIGLVGPALQLFRHFTEVKLEIEVDDNGLVQTCRALWQEDE